MNIYTDPYSKLKSINKSIVNKALTSASGVGGALIPQHLQQIITDTVIRLSPEMSVITPMKAKSNLYEFNRKTSLPFAGGSAGESSVIPATNSKTVRANVSLKIVKSKGRVTDFVKDSANSYIDALQYEVENFTQKHVLDLINGMLFGNKDAQGYMGTVSAAAYTVPNLAFDGIEKFIATNKTNQARGGKVPTDLSFLDDMIDASNRKGGAKCRRFFEMSPEMLSKVSRLLTNVRLNQDYGSGLTTVNVTGGWRMNAYRDIPIIESTSLRPIETMNAGTITLDCVTSGGYLADGTYSVMIAPVTYEGEQLASTAQAAVVSGGSGVGRIRISFATPHADAAGVYNALYYKIYCGGLNVATGSEKLVAVADAAVYDANGARLDPATAANWNGVSTNYLYIDKISSLTVGTNLYDSIVPVCMQSDVPLVSTGSIAPESIVLWCVDPRQGLGEVPFVNVDGDRFDGLITMRRTFEQDAYKEFLLQSFCALTPSYEATSAWSRGWRVG